MADSKNSGAGKFILGAALGTLIGAAAGILLAPKSGKETRQDIKDGAAKATKKVKDGGKKLLSRGKKSAEEKEETEE